MSEPFGPVTWTEPGEDNEDAGFDRTETSFGMLIGVEPIYEDAVRVVENVRFASISSV